jgi:polyphenol oxidase
MTNWHWQTLNGHPYLTCDLLQAWPHGFLTRHFSPLEPTEITTLFQPQAIGYQLKQVHGSMVLTPQEIASTTDRDPDHNLARADGAISDGPAQGLWVASADCNPVIIGDRQTGRVAAVHAGWRGTAQGIVTHTVKKFLAGGSQIENLVAAIGPAIDGEVYQVTTQVGAEVCLPMLPHLAGQAPPAIVAAALALENSPLLPDEQPGRIRLDVRRANRGQLELLGLGGEQISIAPHCTFQEPENFYSYRREKLKRVQWSGIISRG